MDTTTNTTRTARSGGDLAIAAEVAACSAEEDERIARRSAGLRRRNG